MTRGSKTWWAMHVAAGVAVIMMVASIATKCSRETAESDEKDAMVSEIMDLSNKVAKLNEINGGLLDENAAQADTIRMQRDSIVVLNDSLAVVNKELADCKTKRCPRDVKKVPVKPVVKPQPKPAPKPAPKPKADTVYVFVQAPVDTVAVKKPGVNIDLDKSQNNGAIVVGGTKCQQPSVDIKLENGSVNNGAIVVGNNNRVFVERGQVVADTLARLKKTREIIVECEIQTTRRVYR